MNRRALLIAVLLSTGAFAQSEGKRPPRPDNASNARIGGWCDALTGEKKEQCLRDKRRRKPDRSAGGDGKRGTCDSLLGPEKERCLRQGGTIEVQSRPSAGGTSAGVRDH